MTLNAAHLLDHLRRLTTPAALAITGMKSGEAAMWPYWQPAAKR
jgi:hypothetical protein